MAKKKSDLKAKAAESVAAAMKLAREAYPATIEFLKRVGDGREAGTSATNRRKALSILRRHGWELEDGKWTTHRTRL